MIKQKFYQAMTVLQSYLDHEITKKEVLKLYWEKLRHLPDPTWDKIVDNLLENFKPTATTPFPLIGDFLKMGAADPHSRAVNAVARARRAIFKPGVYESVDFGDLALHGVISRYGGWVEICNWTEEDWKFKESGFIRAYEAATMDPILDAPKYLSGIHESNNGAREPVYVGPPKNRILEKQFDDIAEIKPGG